MHLLVLITSICSLLLLSCSTDIAFTGSDKKENAALQSGESLNTEKKSSSERASTNLPPPKESDDYDEEWIALPPEIISEAYLTCVVTDTNAGSLLCGLHRNDNNQRIEVIAKGMILWVALNSDGSDKDVSVEEVMTAPTYGQLIITPPNKLL